MEEQKNGSSIQTDMLIHFSDSSLDDPVLGSDKIASSKQEEHNQDPIQLKDNQLDLLQPPKKLTSEKHPLITQS